MKFPSTELYLAQELDNKDPLRDFRNEFIICDPDLIYMDGNSLGRLPKQSLIFLRETIEEQWGKQLIQSWNTNWMATPEILGSKIAKLIGAQSDEVLVTDSTSVNLFKLIIAALKLKSGRNKIISDEMNFPSDLYIIQGVIDLLAKGHRLKLIPTVDGIHIDEAEFSKVIDDDTALVCLTHVAFKSAFMYDLHKITELAHEAGAIMLWDLSHSTGAVPVDLNASEVDLAVGCTYKYLNGGPGAPAFLYVRKDLQKELQSPIWGWFADKSPFRFNKNFQPAQNLSRFKAGTPPMISMNAIVPAVDLLIKAGIGSIRSKSIQQTEYLIYLFDELLSQRGFSLGSPRNVNKRGSHISIQHPEAYRITRAMTEPNSSEPRFIPDFRDPDNIRLGIAPIYTTYKEINLTISRIQTIIDDEIYKHYNSLRLPVT